MSFSSKVKEELSRKVGTARHCQIAELAAIIGMCGGIIITSDDQYRLKIQTDNVAVARKCFTLLKQIFQIQTEVSVRCYPEPKKNSQYTVAVKKHEDTLMILKTIKFLDGHMEIKEDYSAADNRILQSACCRRAFIRGAFLSAGSMSDPEKSYHFELVCASEQKAEQLKELICGFDMDAKIVCRKKYFVVYLKEGSQIVDLLNVMEAHVALMNLENVRILKEMRNSINRQVNCETANLQKTVSAAVKQIEDIRYLLETANDQELSEELEETARLRLKYPEASLKELGELHSPPVGKSGVNHRLRKLCNMAETLRGNKEEQYYD